MVKRPFGMYLVCATFTLLGLGSVVASANYGSRTVPSTAIQSVHLFLTVLPPFLFAFGILGLTATLLLWIASPWGRRLGLAWALLWILEETAMVLWAHWGPNVIHEASGGFTDTALRITAAVVLFAYLWTVGDRYVETTSVLD